MVVHRVVEGLMLIGGAITVVLEHYITIGHISALVAPIRPKLLAIYVRPKLPATRVLYCSIYPSDCC